MNDENHIDLSGGTPGTAHGQPGARHLDPVRPLVRPYENPLNPALVDQHHMGTWVNPWTPAPAPRGGTLKRG